MVLHRGRGAGGGLAAFTTITPALRRTGQWCIGKEGRARFRARDGQACGRWMVGCGWPRRMRDGTFRAPEWRYARIVTDPSDRGIVRPAAGVVDRRRPIFSRSGH